MVKSGALWGGKQFDMSEEQGPGPSDVPSPPKLAVPVAAISILIVDDHEANRFAFKSALESLGYSLFIAASGREAVALASRYRFALILMDVRMPLMDGVETASVLRKKPFTAKTPIIFISAHHDTVSEVSKLSLEGPIDYIHSPMDSDYLLWKVRQYVGLYLNNERLKLRAEMVWQAQEELLERLKGSGSVPSELRRSVLRLAASLEDLREVISERQGISAS